ncbi:MAG: sulfate ABC transporter substrate-binding protein, partial [Rhodoferax sp.]|nr:sulfate ABC transporter substrate-binding protein [Rhodoferax sp.]
MKKTLRYSLAVLALAVSSAGNAQTLLNASYDVAREFYKDY